MSEFKKGTKKEFWDYRTTIMGILNSNGENGQFFELQTGLPYEKIGENLNKKDKEIS